MRTGFYFKLALDGIRKNKQLYYPYLLTCILMVAVNYIIETLSESPVVSAIHDGVVLQTILSLGNFVIVAFAIVFLFYTSSFLIRRRLKEFGLYNILGMNKFNLGRILMWENLITYVSSMVLGLGTGIALCKIAELGLMNMTENEVNYDFYMPMRAIMASVVIFGVIFLLILLNGVRKVGFSNPMELVRSVNYGEKPPKANWFLGILGVVILAGAYYMAVSIQQPLAAMIFFTIAVIMVIVATYMIFVAGSVVLCRLLQKNKNYYYKKNHFISVASMCYRMKRNGAGLASICILLTMVLVMISSTSSLYFGADDSLKGSYPGELTYQIVFDGKVENRESRQARFHEIMLEEAGNGNIEPSNMMEYAAYFTSGVLDNGEMILDYEIYNTPGIEIYEKLFQLYVLDVDEYNRLYDQNESLGPNEALFYNVKVPGVKDHIVIGGVDWSLRNMPKNVDFTIADANESMAFGSLYLIVDDLDAWAEYYCAIDSSRANGASMFAYYWNCYYDTGVAMEQQLDVANASYASLKAEVEEFEESGRVYANCREYERSDFYTTFGGFFFIGILLSLVFLTAAVLIIYYKQICEGYEDCASFAIMKKVGMTSKEIRSNINSQMLTVFFLPIIFAVLHEAFAFPFIEKLIRLFNFYNHNLLVLTTAGSVVLFSVIYVIVYKITSNAYYNIVK